jgi:hypothetical protein
MAFSPVHEYQDWFHTTSYFYQQYLPELLTRLQPYSVKPRSFDALLGRKKPHRDHVYNLITASGLPSVTTYINKTQKHLIQELPLDIVFLSNGEDNADYNWLRLKQAVPQHSQLHRINGIQGRVQSQHAAAAVCQTPFYFFVPAKLFVNDQFDWNWQPDRLQAPKHYIFNAKNPVTGLEYGHQAMVAYNKKLVLATTGTALDFTLEQAHEVVPILSGTAYYAQTPVSAWRTAFREVIKLRASLPDVESEYRLDRWLNFDNTNQHIVNEEWSRRGAQDAMEYYDEVQGNFDQLCKSYEWSWLASYAMLTRNLP